MTLAFPPNILIIDVDPEQLALAEKACIEAGFTIGVNAFLETSLWELSKKYNQDPGFPLVRDSKLIRIDGIITVQLDLSRDVPVEQIDELELLEGLDVWRPAIRNLLERIKFSQAILHCPLVPK